MVVFLCPVCNDSLRKNCVETHFRRCRGCTAVSCMDCHKEFDKSSFKTHTSCITESEKYDKLHASVKKSGSTKQELWTSAVRNAIRSCNIQDNFIQKVLKDLESCSNLPYKKPKFENFLKSKYYRICPTKITLIWNLLNDHYQRQSNEKTEPLAEPKNKRFRADAVSPESLDLNGSVAGLQPPNSSPNFSIKKAIRQSVKECDGPIPFSELRSKLYSLYLASVPPTSTTKTKKQFKQSLLSILSSGKYGQYSPTDGLVYSSKSPIHEALEKNERETDKNSQTPVCDLDESVVEQPALGMSQLALDIVNENGKRIRLTKLRKQLLSRYTTMRGGAGKLPTEEKLQRRLDKVLTSGRLLILSDDCKYVMLKDQ
ncbi:hypothetical protein P879_00212 [Paragonimus westermani]|uniref:Zinc finger C2H2 LYAR-type domain-containing protein n=1 Tax=Paragonimus westermani TaxID=34504 RepID=A0A8T0DV79_9TREM|nr:hypothetical protein P879_00212 [Paragonimus westermani]